MCKLSPGRAIAYPLQTFYFFTLCWLLPALACAQASPFQTGANSLVTNLVAIATPFAVLAIMVLAVVAMTGRISWGWPVGALVGIGVLFGAPQIVAWVRGLFGV